MKKIKYLVFCAMSFLILGIGANAEEPTDVDLDGAYIIGTHIFTADGPALTTQNIMLAAKTIESDNIEDMVIYYKLPGDDTWYSALDNFEETQTPEGITEEGTIEENYFTYIDLVPQEGAIEANKKFELNSVSNIKTDEIINDQFGQDIKFNQESISITNNGNVINVFENRGMKHWNNGAADEQWYGLLVDLGVNPANLISDSYTIEEIDYTDAKRFGATSDTQFVLWLRGSDEATTRVITFTNEENGEAVALTIKFDGISSFTYETDKDIVVSTNGVTFADGQFNVPNDVTEIKFTEDGVAKTFVKKDGIWTLVLTMNNVSNLTLPEFGADEPYKDEMTYNIPKVNVTNEGTTINVVENELLKAYDNGYAIGEWFGFIVDLGINPTNLTSDSYTILPADITDAKRFGATSDTAFIMWLTEEDFKDGDLVFTFNNGTDAITLTITFDGITGVEYEAKGEITDISNGVTFKENQFIVGLDVSEFTFKDNGSLITAKKDTEWTFSSNFEFVNASEIDTTNIASNEPYYTNIIKNQEAISVVVDGKVITVTKNSVLDYYTNGSGLQKEWYGLILDFGIDPTLLQVDGYTIENIDITDAKRLGATTDTAFVVWLNGLDETRELVFRHKNNNDITDTITVNVVTDYPTLTFNGITKLDFTNIPETENYYDNMLYNNERVSFGVEGNVVTITEIDQLKSYNNGFDTREWYGFLIDLGIDPQDITAEGYGIEEIDITDAHRFGATGNQFIIWLDGNNIDETKNITFKNVNDVNDTITVTFNYVASHEASATTLEELNAYLADSNITTINIAEDIEGITSRVIINRAVTIIGNDNGYVISQPVTITGDNVEIKNVTFNKELVVNGVGATLDGITISSDATINTLSTKSNDKGIGALLVVNGGDFTLKNSIIDNANTVGDVYNAIRIETDGIVIIENNQFINIDDRIYNVIEFSQKYKIADGTTIKGNTFNGQSQNNVISMFNFVENATITIESNHFDFSGNALRVSNYTNANGIIINIKNNTYDDTSVGEYAGFMLFQEVENESFAGITVNVTNLIGPDDTQITGETVGKYVFCYYYADNHAGNILPQEYYAVINFLDAE